VQFESSYVNGTSETFLDIGGSPIGTEDNLYLIILRNVTRRREWLERFIASDKLRALGRLSQGLVHEIRNPLNVVSVNLQFLERSLENNSAERKQTQQALDGVVAIEKVIRETMNFARPQAPARAPFRLNTVVSEIAVLAKTSLLKSKIKLEIEKTAADDSVLADKSQVLHAVLNIVQNAIEAMPNGGTLKFVLDFRATRTKSSLQLPTRVLAWKGRSPSWRWNLSIRQRRARAGWDYRFQTGFWS